MFDGAPVRQPPSFNEADVRDKPQYIRSQPLRSRSMYENNRRKEWAAAVSVDDAVRRIDGALAANGLLDRTVLIFMTDNGYAFGEHRWPTKRCQYNECSRTPLLVRYPHRAGRTDRTHMISNVDIAPTIADIAGTRPAIPQDGASLLPFLLGRSVPWRSELLTHWAGGNAVGTAGWLTSNPQWWGVQTLRYKYVELVTGERELYDEQADPYELNNVVNTRRTPPWSRTCGRDWAGSSVQPARAPKPAPPGCRQARSRPSQRTMTTEPLAHHPAAAAASTSRARSALPTSSACSSRIRRSPGGGSPARRYVSVRARVSASTYRPG